MSNYAWMDLPPELKDEQIAVKYECIDGTGGTYLNWFDDHGTLDQHGDEISARMFLTHDQMRALGHLLIDCSDEARYHWWWENIMNSDDTVTMPHEQRREAYEAWKAAQT